MTAHVHIRRLIRIDAVEPDLEQARVDHRLAEAWFPYGESWMTCDAWPDDDGAPHDTVWIRVRLEPGRLPDRWRPWRRAGWTARLTPHVCVDEEHQALYERFRALRHPDWHSERATELLLHTATDGGALWQHTWELSVRDERGALRGFRWFVVGRHAVAGVAAVFDPSFDGLGSVCRALADREAHGAGRVWSYPGYVRPGIAAHWLHKVKPGRSEWWDFRRRQWRPWDADPPQVEQLAVAEVRHRLAPFGPLQSYPRWAAGCFEPDSRELDSPLYVEINPGKDVRTLLLWDLDRQRYVPIRVGAPTSPASGDPGDQVG